jgi:hypothetical protein
MNLKRNTGKYMAAILTAALLFVTAGCSTPEYTGTRLGPAIDNVLNLMIATELGCEAGQMCTNLAGPAIQLAGNPTQLIPACQDIRCQNGHGAIMYRSIEGGPLTMTVSGGGVVKQTKDIILEIPADGYPMYVWIGDYGTKVVVVSEEMACTGQRDDFKRKFPIPNSCND